MDAATRGRRRDVFPADKVIHTGDLFLTFPPQPFIDYANGGSALEWTKTLDAALQLDFDIAIPGMAPFPTARVSSNSETNFRPCAIVSAAWSTQGRAKMRSQKFW